MHFFTVTRIILALNFMAVSAKIMCTSLSENWVLSDSLAESITRSVHLMCIFFCVDCIHYIVSLLICIFTVCETFEAILTLTPLAFNIVQVILLLMKLAHEGRDISYAENINRIDKMCKTNNNPSISNNLGPISIRWPTCVENVACLFLICILILWFFFPSIFFFLSNCL